MSDSTQSPADLGQLLRLDGRVALVTSAAQRIGREIARTFADQGARVVVADIDDESGTRTVNEIFQAEVLLGLSMRTSGEVTTFGP